MGHVLLLQAADGACTPTAFCTQMTASERPSCSSSCMVVCQCSKTSLINVTLDGSLELISD